MNSASARLRCNVREAQLDAQVLHRARTRLFGERTALINQLRAVLLERGIVVAKSRQQLEVRLAGLLDDEGDPPPTLSARTRLLIEDMRVEWRELDRRIAALTAEFVTRARKDEAARRLTTIPGFGALNATALVAAIGAGETFRCARDLAAGSVSRRDRRQRAASPASSGSRSGATSIYGRS